MEVYNFRIQEFTLRFHEMIQFLEGKGFRPVETFDISYRPSDGALWQMDILFLRTDNPVFFIRKLQTHLSANKPRLTAYLEDFPASESVVSHGMVASERPLAQFA